MKNGREEYFLVYPNRKLLNYLKFIIDGTRIARGTNIQHLLRYKDFRLRINDTYYDVSLPFNRLHFCEKMSTSEKATTIDDLKAKVRYFKLLIFLSIHEGFAI